jgi:TolB-like protein
MNKLHMFIFLLFFCCFSLHAEKIAIWNLIPQAGVTDKEAAAISSILTGEIERISKNKVVSEAEMRSVVDGETMRIACGAEDNVCIAEIGAALGAPFSVSGTLSKMGDYWIITLQLVDVRKVEVKSRVTKRFKGEVNDLVESVTPLVCELFNDKECGTKTTTDVEKHEKAKPSSSVSWKKVTGWTFTTGGILFLAGGIVAHSRMNAAKERYETGYDAQKDADKYNTYKGLAIAGYVAGPLFIAGGITLLVLNSLEKKNKDVSFYMLPSSEGLFAGFYGSW